MEPENTAPSISVAGSICAGLQPFFALHAGSAGGAYQTFSPLAIFSAYRPPALSGTRTSESGAYTTLLSAARPHSTPPSGLPLPMRVCQRISPFFSGSSACTTPDFWPTTITSRPFGSVRTIGDVPMSVSPSGFSGQLDLSGIEQLTFQTSGESCFAQRSDPVSRSNART